MSNNLHLYWEIHSSWSSNHFSFDFISDKVIMHIFTYEFSKKHWFFFLFVYRIFIFSPFLHESLIKYVSKISFRNCPVLPKHHLADLDLKRETCTMICVALHLFCIDHRSMIDILLSKACLTKHILCDKNKGSVTSYFFKANQASKVRHFLWQIIA